MKLIRKQLFSFIFIVLGLLFLWYAQLQTTLSNIEERIEENLAEVIQLAEQTNGNEISEVESNLGIAVFRFHNDSLVYWSKHQIPLSISQNISFDKWHLLRSKGFTYLIRAQQLDSATIVYTGIELSRTYPISNQYLKSNWNVNIFPERTFTILDAESNLGLAIDYKGSTLFRLSTQDLSLPDKSVWINLGFILLVIGLTGLALVLYLQYKQNFTWQKSLIAISLLLPFRLLLFYFFSTLNLNDHYFFSPEFFASSTLNPTLGDLLLNLCFLFYITLIFLSIKDDALKPQKSYQYTGRDYFFGWLLATLLFVAFFFPVALIQTITHNSSEHFSLSTSIIFTKSRIVFIAAWFFSLGLLWLWFDKLWRVFNQYTQHKQRFLLAGAATFSFFNFLNGETYLNLVIPVWLFLFIISWKEFSFTFKILDFQQFIFHFLFLITISIAASFSIQNLEKESLMRNVENYTEAIQSDRNVFTEYLIQNLAHDIQNDVFIQTRMNSPLLSKQVVIAKIKQNYLSGYLNRYQKEIHLFSSTGSGYTKDESLTNDLNYMDSLRMGANQDQFYLRRFGDWISGIHYWMLIPIKRNNIMSGYVTIQLTDSNFNGNEKFPEIWKDDRWQQMELPDKLSLGVIKNDQLFKTIGSFSLQDFELIKQKGLNDYNGKLWHVVTLDEETFVFQVEKPSLFKLFLDAGYLILIGLFILILIFLFLYFFSANIRNSLSYSARIQFLINLSFLFPLLLFSYYLLITLDESYQEKYRIDYLNKFESLYDRLKGISSDTLLVNPSVINQSFEAGINYFEIYDEKGMLIYSNQPIALGNYLPFAVFAKLKSGVNNLQDEEKLGTFNFQTLYAKIPESNLWISSPIYQSSSDISILQSEVLNRVVLIFICVFIFMLWISWIVSTWLVKPFAMFKQSLSATDLFSLDRKLTWQRNDEVQLVVNAFNNMLIKLEESRRDLEKFEREEAWREVAQQVAHEIKNPLTSMKLNLQRLQRDQQINQDQSKLSSIGMVIEQIDLLEQIASSFSNYAKLPNANLKDIDLVNLIQRQLQFRGDEIVFSVEYDDGEKIIIAADEKMLIAILNNLIINAMQANTESNETRIKIGIHADDELVNLTFTDFGRGIPEELATKIFQPHFTTKSGGAGLGLAFVKKMMEAMGGSINLKRSTPGETTFELTFKIYEA